MHFRFEEPIHEEHHQTFHGREQGYMYPVHEEVVHTDPMRDIRGGETFGPAHRTEDMHEAFKREEEEPKDHWVEPVVEEPYDHQDEHKYYQPEMHFSSPLEHPREVEYEVDSAGHVHMYEETPEEYATAFLQ